MKGIRTKNKSKGTLNKLVKLILLLAIITGGYFAFNKFSPKSNPLLNAKKFISTSWTNLNKSTKQSNLDKTLKKENERENEKESEKEIETELLWKYVKKKNGRSIALVTSRNKFNGHDISLGFRCAINGKKKALFLFGKFFKDSQSDGQVSAILNYDNNSKIFRTKLRVVLNGKGLAFKDFKQIENIQKYTRLKIGIFTAKNKSKNFIFELSGSSKSINRVKKDCY